MASDLISSVLFILFTLVGSISVGYLVLRFTYPEVRTFEKNKKLLTAVLVGLCISLTAAALDFATLGLDRFLLLDSFYITFAVFSTMFYFLVLRLYSVAYTSRQEFITVGVPIAHARPTAAPSAPITTVIGGKRKGKEEPAPSVKAHAFEPAMQMPSAPAPMPPAPVTLPVTPPVAHSASTTSPAPTTSTSKPDKSGFKLTLPSFSLPKFGTAKPATTPATTSTKPTTPVATPAPAPVTKHEQKPPTHAPQPAQPIQSVQPSQPKPTPAYLLAVQQKAHELEKAITPKPHEKKQEPVSTKKQEAKQPTKPTTPAITQPAKPVVPQQVTAKPVQATGAKLEELKKEIGTDLLEISIPFKTDAVVTKPPVSSPVATQVPVRAGGKSIKPGMRTSTQVTADAAKQSAPTPVAPPRPSIANAFGLMIPQKHPEPQQAPTKPTSTSSTPAPSQSGQTSFKSWREKQGIPVTGQSPAGPSSQPAPKSSIDDAEAILNDIMKNSPEARAQAQQQAQSGPMHRRYMAQEGQSVKVIADKQLAQTEEFNILVQDIYSQLQTSRKDSTITSSLSPAAATPTAPAPVTTAQPASVAQTAHAAHVAKSTAPTSASLPSSTAAAAAAPITSANAGLSLSDILGTSPATGSAGGISAGNASDMFSNLPGASETTGGGHSLFSDLEAISSGKTTAPSPAAASTPMPQPVAAGAGIPGAPAAQSDVSFVQIKAEHGMGCPTCHAQNSKIIFCPYCGTGMCANCSPSIKPTGPGQFVYTCPKCSEEVNVNKRN